MRGITIPDTQQQQQARTESKAANECVLVCDLFHI
jgi:hypothetical protein